MRTVTIGVVSALGGVLASAGVAAGAITGTAGAVTQIAAPPSCLPGAITTSFFSAWDEQTNITGPLPAEMTANPSSSAVLTPGLVSGLLNSHFMHLETLPGMLLTGSITFDGPIVGVALRDTSLDVSDLAAGAPLTLYPTGTIFRGIGPPLANPTLITINPTLSNPNRLDFVINTSNPAGGLALEQMRIYTKAVPAPGSAALLAGAGVLAGRRRRAERPS